MRHTLLALAALATLSYTVVASANTAVKMKSSSQGIAPSDRTGGSVDWDVMNTEGGAVNVDIVGSGHHTCALYDGDQVVATSTSTTHCKLDYIVPSGSQHSFVWVAVNNDPTFYNLSITTVVWQ
jgi:hypothetical protein